MEFYENEFKRASLLSNPRPSEKTKTNDLAPKDKYLLVHIIFFFFGLGSYLSLPFFLTANDYWMFKFRDVSQPNYNASNKTDLQRFFASASSITQSVPGLITTILTSLYGHKVNIKTRIYLSLFAMASMYLVFTIFVEINTDNFQKAFFYITLIGHMVITISTSVFSTVMMTLIARFPHTYMRTQFFGQGATGIFSALLEIIALSAVDDSSSAGLIYFTVGSVVLLITSLLGVLSFKLEFFRYYLGDTVADTKRGVYRYEDVKEGVKRGWSCMLIFLTIFGTMGLAHPNITSLVVSENYGDGTDWSNKYFVPVATYLVYESFHMIGRGIGMANMTKENLIYFVTVHIIRLLLLTPIFIFCNARPRHHDLIVLFPHDWEYISILSIFSLSGSYLLTCGMLSLPKLAGDKTEVAFLFMVSVGSAVSVINSFLSPLYVAML